MKETNNMKIYCILIIFLFNVIIFGKYIIKDNVVYFGNSKVYSLAPYTHEVIEADASTFEIINEKYGKDKNKVYYGRTNIRGANPKNFEIFEYGFSKDEENVYRYRSFLSGIDTVSFKVFKNQEKTFTYGYTFFEDKNGIYAVNVYGADTGGYCELTNKKNNINTFKIMKEGYVEYNEEIYFGCNKIEKADKKTFEVLELGFSKDKKNVYYFTTKIEDVKINIKTVEIFKNQDSASSIFYLKDRNVIYVLIEKNILPLDYKVEKISTDIKNFKILENGNSEDEKCKYFYDDKKRVINRKCGNK